MFNDETKLTMGEFVSIIISELPDKEFSDPGNGNDKLASFPIKSFILPSFNIKELESI